MSPKPPRPAAWLVDLFAPGESAEGVLGDLQEEFTGRLTRSGHRAARHWYWRQAVRTTVHLLWGSVRTRPWSTTAQVLASLVVGLLLYGMVNIWVGRLVSNLPIYDYDTSVWSWRAAAIIRFVAMPVALGWSIAALARGREMIITTLVVGVLVGMLLLTLTVNARLLVLGPGQRLGLYWALMYVFEVFLVQTIFPLGVMMGGMIRRLQELRKSARLAV
jgi:hypothetical protein